MILTVQAGHVKKFNYEDNQFVGSMILLKLTSVHQQGNQMGTTLMLSFVCVCLFV